MPRLNINNHPEFGFFGKLPINGDFIQRNLSQRFVHRWDNWLQNNLLAVQQHFGSQWTEHYLTSPIWRFFISPAVIDTNAYIGIVAPSVDRVGRYFPMTIAIPVHPQQIPALFSSAMQAIYTDLESTFLTYLHADNANIDELSLDLEQSSLAIQEIIHRQQIDILPETLNCHRFILSDQADMAGAVSSLWQMNLMKQHTNATLWWSNGSQSIEPSLLVNSGLPNKHQFVSMLAGFDGSHHWRQQQLSIVINEPAAEPIPEEHDIQHNLASDPTDLSSESMAYPSAPDILTPPSSTDSQASINDASIHQISSTVTDAAVESPIDIEAFAPPIITNKELPVDSAFSEPEDITANPLIDQSAVKHMSALPIAGPITTPGIKQTSSPAKIEPPQQERADPTQKNPINSDITQPNFLQRPITEVTTSTPLDLTPTRQESTPEAQLSAAFCETGHRRKKNQDAILSHSNHSMWVVADGMGGHSAGERASQAIVEQLSQLELHGDIFDSLEQIKGVLNQVNREILAFSKAEQVTCGSTVVILLRSENQCAYLWAGDSRLYLRRNDQLIQLTQDHSVHNEYPPSDTAPKAKANHAITRAIGVYEQLDVESGFILLEPGDRFLLCSDGLYGDLSNEQINLGLSYDAPLTAGDFLKQTVLSGEARDNLSGILIWF
ncbi:MAG: type VI secretion system-associated protein TagF [Gammaproteobacteria bacterium]|nr:MAG: type VI secretion system-associated protein TagF [Gammaproteobacteria bacterium]